MGVLTLGLSNGIVKGAKLITPTLLKLGKLINRSFSKAFLDTGNKIIASARKLGAKSKDKVMSFANSFRNNPRR